MYTAESHISYSPPVLQLIVKRRAGGARNFVEKTIRSCEVLFNHLRFILLRLGREGRPFHLTVAPASEKRARQSLGKKISQANMAVGREGA